MIYDEHKRITERYITMGLVMFFFLGFSALWGIFWGTISTSVLFSMWLVIKGITS